MTRLDLERRQVWISLVAILCGLTAGLLWPGASRHLEAPLWPLLCILIFVTFTQVHLTRLPEAFRNLRFMGALLAGNFVIVPLVELFGTLVYLKVVPRLLPMA